MALCEGLAKGFAKDLSKDLTCNAKESKGFYEGHTYKQHYFSLSLKGYRGQRNPFNPFASQVRSFANPFAKSFATPSHPVRGPR
jgi:hypothetical protein